MRRRDDLSSGHLVPLLRRGCGRSHLLVLLLLGVAIAGICATPAQAQDLSRYGGSNISVAASSTTGGGNSGDGIPATSAGFGVFTVASDAAGNLYFTTAQDGRVRMVYVRGPVPALLQFALAYNAILNAAANSQLYPTTAVAGDVYTIADVQGTIPCSGGDCGDGGQAAAAGISLAWGLVFDTAGDLYVSDEGAGNVRKISASDGTISTVAGDSLHTSTGYNGDNIPALGAFLSGPQFLALDANNNLFITDTGNNLIRRVDASSGMISTVAGNNTMPGVYCADTICGEGGAATAATLGAAYGVAVNTAGDVFVVEQNLHVVRKVDHATGNINTFAGQLGVACADSMCGGEGVAATLATLNAPFSVHLSQSGQVVITDTGDNAIRGVDTSGKMYTLAGVLAQAGALGPLTGPASAAMFNFPVEALLDPAGDLLIGDNGNNLLWSVIAPVSLAAQTITFNQIPDATYGNAAFDLSRYASSDSLLPLTFTCTGAATCTGTNGATLTITGAGSVTVTANQAGDTTHAPAAPQTSTFQVAKAPLTVKATNISIVYRSAAQLPTLTFTYAGLVDGDSVSVVTGAPALTTTATAASAVGQYPIIVGAGTLAAANYTFTPQNGILTITGGAAQTITFAALPNVTYGVATFNAVATATSGDPVTFSVVGPARILGSAITVTGAGTVSVTANQAGDVNYGPATAVTQSFQVAPSVLTITANPATRAYNTVNSAFTFTASGFVSADNASVLTGAPAYTTTATLTSPTGSYPLTISQGTLFASNYTFTFVNSTLTVGLAPQTITFPAIPTQQFGPPVTLAATSTSGLAVVYTVTAPGAITGNVLTVLKPATVTVTATQAGNDLYAPATPVTQTFVAQKQPATVVVGNYTVPFGGEIPVFTYQVGVPGFVLPANEYSGQFNISTTAGAGSAPGQYPIVIDQGTVVSDYFDFKFVNGTLTILQPSSFILTASPPSITIPAGQARQVTILLTPVNNFIGTVTIGCSDLPAGVTCTASPNALQTVPASASGVQIVQAVSGTLTISAGAPTASAQNRTAASDIRVAGWFWLPSLLLGALLTWQRKRLLCVMLPVRLLLIACLLAGASSIVACGSSSSTSNSIKPGTTTIQVTGAGTSTSGPASASLSLSVTIQ